MTISYTGDVANARSDQINLNLEIDVVIISYFQYSNQYQFGSFVKIYNQYIITIPICSNYFSHFQSFWMLQQNFAQVERVSVQAHLQGT